MPCYHPIHGWQQSNGLFSIKASGLVVRPLTVPCGRCIGCRIDRSTEWATRCLQESQLHEVSCFVTLTYNDENLPGDESLDHSHVQLFLKRLRALHLPHRFSYFMCGEYGELRRRPHYHLCLFGIDFPDKTLLQESDGRQLFESKTLERTWQLGYATVGNFSFETAAYTAGYCMKKITGEKALEHYRHITRYGELVQLTPEYMRCSTNPGIGKQWFEKFSREVFPLDRVVVNARELKPPRYYEKLLAKRGPSILPLLKAKRIARMDLEETTPARLKARETVATARASQRSRNLE